MDIIKPKEHHEYSNNIARLFHLLTFKKSEPIIMGSNAGRFAYGADYDLFSVVHTHDSLEKLKNVVAREFKEIMQQIKGSKDIYFIEFMAGVDHEGKPLRWSMNEIISGKHDKYLFKDILNERSVIKIEIVGYIPGQGFVPMSNVYEFRTSDGKGINQEAETRDTVDSLKKDIKKFHDKGNLMKVLKRLFVISLTEKNKKLSEKLINIFESDIGKIYKVKSDLETINEVTEKYHDKTVMERVYNEIQKIKEFASAQTIHKFKQDFYKKMDRASKTKNHKTLHKLIESLCEYILKAVNKLLKAKMKLERISYKKYL